MIKKVAQSEPFSAMKINAKINEIIEVVNNLHFPKPIFVVGIPLNTSAEMVEQFIEGITKHLASDYKLIFSGTKEETTSYQLLSPESLSEEQIADLIANSQELIEKIKSNVKQ